MRQSIIFLVSLLCYASLFSQSIIDSSLLIDSLIIYYDSDTYELKEEQIDTIMTFVKKSKDGVGFHYVIKSYTDSDGSNNYNYKLAQNRYHGVLEVLSSMAIELSKVEKEIYGESGLSKPEYNEIEKADNRRTILKVRRKVQFINVNVQLLSNAGDTLLNPQIKLYYDGLENTIDISSPRNMMLPIPLNEKVEMHFTAKNHFPMIKRLLLRPDKEATKIRIPFKKMSLDSTMVTTLQFEAGRSVFLSGAYNELYSLAYTLNRSDDVCVELSGHINRPNEKPVDVLSDYHKLSIARSRVVFEYLVNESINKDRLLARGFGNRHMVYPKAKTKEQYVKNRRVEVKVISCDTASILVNDYIDDDDYDRFKTVGLIDDDINFEKMINLSLSKLDPDKALKMKFNVDDLKNDKIELSDQIKADLMKQAKFLKENGDDAKKYSYMELLKQYKERVKK